MTKMLNLRQKWTQPLPLLIGFRDSSYGSASYQPFLAADHAFWVPDLSLHFQRRRRRLRQQQLHQEINFQGMSSGSNVPGPRTRKRKYARLIGHVKQVGLVGALPTYPVRVARDAWRMRMKKERSHDWRITRGWERTPQMSAPEVTEYETWTWTSISLSALLRLLQTARHRPAVTFGFRSFSVAEWEAI